MENQVIKVLNREHGADVVKYWESVGIKIDPLNYKGEITLEDHGEHAHIYYGVIDGNFSNYSIRMVRRAHAQIIELPEHNTKQLEEAFKSGKTTQVLYRGEWIDKKINIYPGPYSYRIKPEEWKPKRGERVLVWDREGEEKVERIFLTEIEGTSHPFYVVPECEEKKFLEGKPFTAITFKKMYPVPEKVKVSIQDIANWKGVDVEQIEIV